MANAQIMNRGVHYHYRTEWFNIPPMPLPAPLSSPTPGRPKDLE